MLYDRISLIGGNSHIDMDAGRIQQRGNCRRYLDGQLPKGNSLGECTDALTAFCAARGLGGKAEFRNVTAMYDAWGGQESRAECISNIVVAQIIYYTLCYRTLPCAEGTAGMRARGHPGEPDGVNLYAACMFPGTCVGLAAESIRMAGTNQPALWYA
jgi:hypothetical protein